jgi:Ca2+-transporting ATPase
MAKKKVNSLPLDSEQPEILWHALTAEDVAAKLNTQVEQGLSSEIAQERLEKFGLNQLAEKPRPSFLSLVLAQLKSFVVILLIVASVISAILGEWVDAAAILTIVVLNAILGVVQESRAEEALAALKKMAAPDSHVLRDGKRVIVPSAQLVPGDVVFLEAGNFVPADMRLLESVNLRVDEAALTGESVPVQKNATLLANADSSLGDRKNTAFMGTVVSYGRGKGVVVSTGMHTQLGLIATMLQAVEEEETPLQKRLDQLGKTLGIACLAVCAIVFVTGMIEGGDPLALFMIAVSLAIAAVPEGLPAIVTISLALGMREMINRHALIRRLSSVETLGSATVICSDKTGTLTQNEMTVTRIWVDGKFVSISGQGYSPAGDFSEEGKTVDLDDLPAVRTALWVGALNNDAILEKIEKEDGSLDFNMVGDPTEGSLLVAAYKGGALANNLNHAYPRINEVPFDSERKRMVTIHTIDLPQKSDISPFLDDSRKKWHVIAVKGAPDLVLNLCSSYQPMNDGEPLKMDAAARHRIISANDEMTKDALRVLGVAYRVVEVLPEEISAAELEKDLTFVGLIGMIDPARPEVKPALLNAANAGIRTIMITGDYPNTAKAIAEGIGLLRRATR